MFKGGVLTAKPTGLRPAPDESVHSHKETGMCEASLKWRRLAATRKQSTPCNTPTTAPPCASDCMRIGWQNKTELWEERGVKRPNSKHCREPKTLCGSELHQGIPNRTDARMWHVEYIAPAPGLMCGGTRWKLRDGPARSGQGFTADGKAYVPVAVTIQTLL